MASGLENYVNSLNEKISGEFVASPYYEPDGDSLIFYVRDVQSYAKRLNPLLTVFLSSDDHSLVGCEVKGVQHMLRLAGDFGLLVHDADIKLRILLAFALVPQPDDPSLDRYADDLRNFVGDDIEMRREDLVRA
jgi:hypothetical protein